MMPSSLLLLLLPLAANGSFVTPLRPDTSRHVTSPRQRSLTIHKVAARDDDEENNKAFDVEAARQRLEALLVGVADEAPSQQQQGSTIQNRVQPLTTRTVKEQPFSVLDSFFGSSHLQQRHSDSPNPLVPSSLDEKSLSVLDKPLRDSLTQTLQQQPLTATELERRQTEISLLSQLTSSDEALDELTSFWSHERGLAKANTMKKIEQFMNNSAKWNQAEILIRQLIQEHGTSWAEPMNRLATLFYMQGRLPESEIMCQLVLQVKPWHFGALSSLAMVYSSLGKTNLAKQWAARRLPSLPPPQAQELNRNAAMSTKRHRLLWVHTATGQAIQAIRQLELERDIWWGAADGYQSQKTQSLEQVFVASDNDSSNIQTSREENEDTWQ